MAFHINHRPHALLCYVLSLLQQKHLKLIAGDFSAVGRSSQKIFACQIRGFVEILEIYPPGSQDAPENDGSNSRLGNHPGVDQVDPKDMIFHTDYRLKKHPYTNEYYRNYDPL